MATEHSVSAQTERGTVTLRRWTVCPPDLCAQIHRVCLEAPNYFLSVEGKLPDTDSIQNWFTEDDLPFGCTSEHHFVFGISLDDELIGVTHVLAACRDPEQATLGLMLLSEQYQGQGLGRAVYELLERHIHGWGMKSCRIGVVANNQNALSFWRTMGFVQIGDMAALEGFLDRTIIMEKHCA